MKRVFRGVLTGVCIAVLAASIGTTTVFAAGPGSGSRFVDANGDGVCDNYTAAHSGAWVGYGSRFVDANGDGVCDNCTAAHSGAWVGYGSRFVDTNGDGVCDNYAARRICMPAWAGAMVFMGEEINKHGVWLCKAKKTSTELWNSTRIPSGGCV